MKLFSLMVLLCASLGGYAQDIKGRVVEQENGKKVGLPGANVYWAGTTDGVVTDAEGHFKIKWNKSGRLVASFIGYRTDTLTVSGHPGKYDDYEYPRASDRTGDHRRRIV